jgi:hypothetical protein
VPSTLRRPHPHRSIIHPLHLPSTRALSLASSSPHLISPHCRFGRFPTPLPHTYQDHPHIHQARLCRPPSPTCDTASRVSPEKTTTHPGSKPSSLSPLPHPYRNPSTQEPFSIPSSKRTDPHPHPPPPSQGPRLRFTSVSKFGSVSKYDSVRFHTLGSSVLRRIQDNGQGWIWSSDFKFWKFKPG